MNDTAGTAKNGHSGSGKNIILIGMPGAGKTTIGPLLAGKTGLSFIDTDAIVKKADGRELRDIVAEDGLEAFLSIQQEAIMSLEIIDSVIATGGSVVVSTALMRHFKKIGRIVYLKVDILILEQRLASGRKLARTNGQTFRQLFAEREPLYMKYADSIIECTGKTPEQIINEI